MKTLMRVPEDKIELAKSQGAVIDEDGFAAIEQTTWKEKDGKFYYDTKVKGEVLGETVDPFAEIPVDENGCLTIAYGTTILERVGDDAPRTDITGGVDPHVCTDNSRGLRKTPGKPYAACASV